MPEWHDPQVWTRMGLWDLESRGGKLERIIHQPTLQALRAAQALFGEGSAGGPAFLEGTGQEWRGNGTYGR